MTSNKGINSAYHYPYKARVSGSPHPRRFPLYTLPELFLYGSISCFLSWIEILVWVQFQSVCCSYHWLQEGVSWERDSADAGCCEIRTHLCGRGCKLTHISSTCHHRLYLHRTALSLVSFCHYTKGKKLLHALYLSVQFYYRGVYRSQRCSSSSLTHAMLLIGYGTANQRDYWLVKNRWSNWPLIDGRGSNLWFILSPAGVSTGELMGTFLWREISVTNVVLPAMHHSLSSANTPTEDLLHCQSVSLSFHL